MSQLALLGTGTVGAAFVARHQHLRAEGHALPRLAWLANSRGRQDCADAPGVALEHARRLPFRDAGSDAAVGDRDGEDAIAALDRGDVVVDASASDALAGRHAAWLERGLHVVTANKLGAGAALSRARTIVAARRRSGVLYGDGATVGAGLPLLPSLRALTAGGDRIHGIAGVLSGSMAWLFHHYDGSQPFSGLVAAASRSGITEPDPRLDLSGEDVRRKLLILARASGLWLEADQVQVESLVPTTLADLPRAQLEHALACIDAGLAERFERAHRTGAKLRFVARMEIAAEGRCRASVGLEVLAADDPLCGGQATDNRVAIHSCRYRERPLLIQGPGAGAGVTAAALLDDVLRTMRREA